MAAHMCRAPKRATLVAWMLKSFSDSLGLALTSSTFSPYRMNRQSPQNTPYAKGHGTHTSSPLSLEFGKGMA